MTVYFACRADTGAVKIGCVTDIWEAPGRKTAAEYRLTALEKEAGVPLHFAALTAGHLFVEHWFHRRYRAEALGHEWFGSSRLLLEDVAAMSAGERLDNQPEEPGVKLIPGTLLQHYRARVLGVPDWVMSTGVGYKNLISYRTAERRGISILRAVEIAELAGREGVDLSLSRIVRDAARELRRVAQTFASAA